MPAAVVDAGLACYAAFMIMSLYFVASLAGTNDPAVSTRVAAVREACGGTTDCAEITALIRELHGPEGVFAAQVLAEVGSVRAVAPLTNAAAYGSEVLRPAARSALYVLAKDNACRAELQRCAAERTDPELAKVCLESLPPAAAAVAAPDERGNGESTARFSDPDPGRLMNPLFGGTALQTKTGIWRYKVVNLGIHRFEYAATDNVEIGVTTVVPIFVAGVIPSVRVSFPVSDSVAVGFGAFAGVGGLFGVFSGGGTLWTVGGNVSLTAGHNDGLGTIGCTFIRAGVDDQSTWLALPSIGGGVQLGNRVKLIGEMYFVTYSEVEDFLAVLFYGVRIFGDSMFGDVGFAVPLYEDTLDLLRYVPLGFPVLSFGLNW